MKTDEKTSNRTQQYIKASYTMIKWNFPQGYKDGSISTNQSV